MCAGPSCGSVALLGLGPAMHSTGVFGRGAGFSMFGRSLGWRNRVVVPPGDLCWCHGSTRRANHEPTALDGRAAFALRDEGGYPARHKPEPGAMETPRSGFSMPMRTESWRRLRRLHGTRGGLATAGWCLQSVCLALRAVLWNCTHPARHWHTGCPSRLDIHGIRSIPRSARKARSASDWVTIASTCASSIQGSSSSFRRR